LRRSEYPAPALRSKSSPDIRLPVHVEVALIALFFLALLALGLSFGDPIFEPVAKSRLTYLTLLGLPVLALLAICTPIASPSGSASCPKIG
jgi:hypothetical protein